MKSAFSFIVLLAYCTLQSAAFTIVPPSKIAPTRLFAQGDKEGGAAIAKPKVNIGQKTALVTDTKQVTVQKRKVQTGPPVTRREEDFEDAPMFKLMLLGDDAYDAGHVIERMCAIVEDMDAHLASTVFKQANQNGKAMCGKYPFERAELFKEQLIRSDPMIFSDLEEENK